MSQEAIDEEVKRQVDGREDDARLSPRLFAYRVLTVLGLGVSRDLVDSTEWNITEYLGEVDDDDDGWAGYDTDDEDPNAGCDQYSYVDAALAPPLMKPPLTVEEEAVLLIRHGFEHYEN